MNLEKLKNNKNLRKGLRNENTEKKDLSYLRDSLGG